MATVSRWRSSRPVRLRLELVGLEVFLLALMIFVAGVSDLPVFVWLVLAFVSVVVQTVLFYNIGRVREKLER
jgi:membrane protein implicated in regulation of membrane protease activity